MLRKIIFSEYIQHKVYVVKVKRCLYVYNLIKNNEHKIIVIELKFLLEFQILTLFIVQKLSRINMDHQSLVSYVLLTTQYLKEGGKKIEKILTEYL